MGIDPQPRRKVLKYLGTGAAVSTAGVYGLSQLSQPASAEVAVGFEDSTVDVHGVDSIEDLRINGNISGDYNAGSEPIGSVSYRVTVDFADFGSFIETNDFYPEESKGTVSWQPSWSLIEKTDFEGDRGDLRSPNYDATEMAYPATVSVEMHVTSVGSVIASDSTSQSATITFDYSKPDDDGTETGSGGTETETASASVEIIFGFEVDK